jgi:hypothetical protein
MNDGSMADASSAASDAAASSGNAAATPSTSWYGGFDSETRGYLANKGWATDKGPVEVVKAYRSLERMQRAEQVPWPKDANDKDGYDRIFNRLGRPKSWQEYGVKLPAGGNQDYAEHMQQAFHEAGLSTAQVQAISAKSNARVAELRQAADQAFRTQSASELNTVRKEWGQDADHNFPAAQRFAVAAQSAGLDQAAMEKIERAIGTKAMMGLFAWAGRGLTEDRGPGGGQAFGRLSPQMAQARLNDLKHDKGWTDRYLAGGATEKAEYDRLIGIVAG